MKTTLTFIFLIFIIYNTAVLGQSKIIIKTTYENGRVTNKKIKLKTEIDTSYNYIDLQKHNLKDISKEDMMKISSSLVSYGLIHIKYKGIDTAKYKKYTEAIKYINDTLKISFDDLYNTLFYDKYNSFLNGVLLPNPPYSKLYYYNDNNEKWCYNLYTKVGESFDVKRLKIWYHLYCSSFYKKVFNVDVNTQFSDIVFYKLILDYLYEKNNPN